MNISLYGYSPSYVRSDNDTMNKVWLFCTLLITSGCSFSFSLIPEPAEPEVFLVAARVTPDNPHALYLAGSKFLENDKPEKALKMFQKSIKVKPDFIEAYIAMGRAWEALHRFDNARKSYQKALKLEPNNYQARNALGWALFTLGNFSDARDAIQPLFDSGNATLSLYTLLAYTFYLEGDYDRSIEIMKETIDKFPDADPTLIMIHEDLTRYLKKYGP